ncbi:MAG TPA: hypothetical protein VGI23_18010 [Steroidobacteraceae bacterium]
MTDPEQDEVFEAYLQRRPVLPTLDDPLEPPAALDHRVLNQAREAIQPGATTVAGSRDTAGVGGGGGNTMSPGATKSPLQRPPRWAVPVALAATILLCLSVVMNISLNSNRRSPNIERMTAARADVKASALANATAESDAAAGVSARSPARDAFAANNGERRESISGDVPSHEVVLPRAKVAGAPAPHAPVVAEASAPASATGAPADSAPPAVDASRRNSNRNPASADTPARQLTRSLAEASAPAAHPGSDSTNASERKSERGLADTAGRASGAMASVNSGAAVQPAEPGGAANVTGGAVPVQSPSAADKAVLMAKDAGVAAPQYTPAPEQERAAASARKADKAAAVAPHPADPKIWLQQIDALRAAGKADQADAELRRFKATFPNYGTPSAAPDLPK